MCTTDYSPLTTYHVPLTPHYLYRLREELTTTHAYVRLLRAAKDRSDHQAGSLDSMMAATAALLGRRRRSSALSRAWRRWAGWWRRRRAATEAEARAVLEAALSRARGDARVRHAERAELEASLGRANLQLGEIVISSQLERAELGRRLSEMEAERGRSMAASEAAGVRVEAVRCAEAATHASELGALERLHREGLEVAEAARQRAEAAARVAQAEKRQVTLAAPRVHRTCTTHTAWHAACTPHVHCMAHRMHSAYTLRQALAVAAREHASGRCLAAALREAEEREVLPLITSP